MRDQEVFLGFLREEDEHRYAGSPLLGEYDGRPAAVWNFGDGGPPHAGIWGTTGGGKSSLLRMILRGLVRRPGTRAITVIDAEGAGEFSMFRRMPGIAQIVNMNPATDQHLPDGAPTSVELAAQALTDHKDEATERQMEANVAADAWEAYVVDPAHHQPPKYTPPAEAFLIIDGWATFCYNLNRYHKGRQDPVEDAIWTSRNGRKTDVHLVLADQVSYAKRSKDDTGLPSPLRKQLGLRIAAVGPLGLTKTEAGQVFDDQDVIVPKELGGCLMKVGASTLPYVVPPWKNATDPRADLSPDQRRESFRLLPDPLAEAS
jgi:Helicase HerA, central domain